MKWGWRQQPRSGSPSEATSGRGSGPSIFSPPEPFADRYIQLRLLGRGGFGEVYRAMDTQMERPVALKLLKREHTPDADWRRRFRQEATRNLIHPNITINFDVGEYQDQPFIVMELVEGQPLSKFIEGQVPLTDLERLPLIEQLCDGLHYAHTQKVVHRDIKPANLMVCEKQQDDRIVRTLKILDFGISKVVSTEETATGSFMFSPPYVSPEQVKGEQADPRSDMFAVGAVAYELLCYQKAFDIQSKNLFEILNEVRRKNAEEPHRSLLEVRPDIDAQLSDIIDRSLAKRPEDRFRDLAEMGRELRKVRERLEDDASEDSGPTVVLSPTVQGTVREARQAIEAGDPTAALGKLEHALRSRLSRPERRILEEILAVARERHYVKSGARHESEHAAAAEAVQWARTAFAKGQRTAAVERLKRFEPIELVVDELETLRTTKEALAQAERAVNAGTIAEGHEAIEYLERSCRPELVAADVVRLRDVADNRPAAQYDPSIIAEPYEADLRQQTGASVASTSAVYQRVGRAAAALIFIGIVAAGAYKWFASPGTTSPSASPGTAEPVADPSVAIRQRITDLWAKEQHTDALTELEKAVSQRPQDRHLADLRARFEGEATKASEEARGRADNAGAGGDQFYDAAAAAVARAQAHAAGGRHIDGIRAHLEAARNFNRALKNTGPVAEVDGYLKSNDHVHALKALTAGLKESPDSAVLQQRLDDLRTAAIKRIDAVHQALTSHKAFDQGAPDYRALLKQYASAKSRPGPDAVQTLWELPDGFTAAGQRMSEAAALHARGVEEARAGKSRDALATLRDARTRFPGYAKSRELAQHLRKWATDLAKQTKEAASAAGATTQNNVSFEEAVTLEQQASRATNDEAAIEALQEAAKAYERAGKQAQRIPSLPPKPVPTEPSPSGSAPPGRNPDKPNSVAPPAGAGATTSTAPSTAAKPGENVKRDAVSERAMEKKAIEETIHEYQEGYRKMSPPMILNVYPTFSKERQKQLQDAKRSCRASPIQFVDDMKTAFTDEGEGATVTVRVRYGCDRTSGGDTQFFEAHTEFFTLAKENGRWLIKDMPGK